MEAAAAAEGHSSLLPEAEVERQQQQVPEAVLLMLGLEPQESLMRREQQQEQRPPCKRGHAKTVQQTTGVGLRWGHLYHNERACGCTSGTLPRGRPRGPRPSSDQGGQIIGGGKGTCRAGEAGAHSSN